MRAARIDACLTLISNRHRRRAIQQLRQDFTGEMTIDDLLDRLHSRESTSPTDPRTDREQLAIQLIHTHLPKLADFGVVEIDPVSETVRYQPDEQLEEVLDSLPEEVARIEP